jgi:hypothetical protein
VNQLNPLPCLPLPGSACSLSIEVRGPSRDLHSGNEGGVFAEPLADLSKVLASLVDSHNNILVPGFYANVRPDMLEAALPRLEQAHEFSLDGCVGWQGWGILNREGSKEGVETEAS